jgi:hypothetical protein
MSDAFPRNLVEFTERFASEEACMVYLMTIKLRHIKKSLDNKNKTHKWIEIVQQDSFFTMLISHVSGIVYVRECRG